MFSDCLSFLSAGAYELVDFIRNNSQTSILISIGSLFFLLGTALRHHLPPIDEMGSSHTPIVAERAVLSKPHWEAPEVVTTTYATAGQNEELA